MYLAKLKKQEDTAMTYGSSFYKDNLITHTKTFLKHKEETKRLLQVPNEGCLYFNTEIRQFGDRKEKESLV